MEHSLAPVVCRAVLVIGGARSGKSRYACRSPRRPPRAGLSRHRRGAATPKWPSASRATAAERGEGWRTLEVPLALAPALRAEARPGRIVVVDCLTLWLANLMQADLNVEAQVSELMTVLSDLGGPAILISNEVGAGIVPATPLGRAFRDWQGRLNQSAAAACGAVVAVAAGLPTQLKPAPRPDVRLR